MNYIKMVDFIKVDKNEVTARFIVKENERNDILNKSVLVPNFLILEAIFQTAGKVAREYTNNKSGGTIVSFKNISYAMPIFTNDLIYIEARLVSYNRIRKCFYIKLSVVSSGVIVVKECDVIIMQDTSIKTKYLNNTDNLFKENVLKKMGY